MNPAIEVSELHKRYGEYEAVRGISFTVEPGEVVAFLGPNGAGKTTTVEILEGYRNPTKGEIAVLGMSPIHKPTEFHQRVGIVLQEAGFLPELTVLETVTAWDRMYTNSLEPKDVIARVGLEHRISIRVKNLSGGEKRRLDLALGMLGQPELLFLDEPTTGFDPSARRNAWELIKGMSESGTTIFLTTHYLDEAQYLASRVIVIAKGEIIADGTPEQLRAKSREGMVSFTIPSGFSVSDIPQSNGAKLTTAENAVTLTTTDSLTKLTHDITSWATERSVELEGLTVRNPSLEDVYLELIGENET